MKISGLSLVAWGGGGIAGAAMSPRHRLAGGALGAILVGSVTDVLVERRRRGLSITGAALSGIGLIALTTIVVSRGDRRAGD